MDLVFFLLLWQGALTRKQPREERVCLEYNSKLQFIIEGMSGQKFKHNVRNQE